MTTSIRSSLLLTIAALFLAGYSFLGATWTAPGTTPPNGNTPTPINVSSTTQAKSGNLMANIIAAATEMRSNRYCNSLGGNCFSPDTLRISCPADHAITAITENGAVCSKIGGGTNCSYQTRSVSHECGESPQCPAGMTVISTRQVSGCGGSDGNSSAMSTTCGGNICSAPVTYSWRTGGWSCSGVNREGRAVWCVSDIDGSTVSESLCDASTKPATTRTASLGSCGR